MKTTLLSLLFVLLSAGPAPGFNIGYYNGKLENFRLYSAEKLNDLYTLRNMYIDSNDAVASEGVQLFIGEVRKSMYLTGNLLDITFLSARIPKEEDEKGLVREYLGARIGEINDNIEFTALSLEELVKVLRKRNQATLAMDFASYKSRLQELHGHVTGLRQAIEGKPEPAPAPPAAQQQ